MITSIVIIIILIVGQCNDDHRFHSDDHPYDEYNGGMATHITVMIILIVILMIIFIISQCRGAIKKISRANIANIDSLPIPS